MISFYPGPSRVEDKIPAYLKDAFRDGILSMNHRSKEFIALSKKTTAVLKRKLRIPADYMIFFTSSATESWEILAQSLIGQESIHLYNGAFGEKWFRYTKNLRPASRASVFDREAMPGPSPMSWSTGDVICLTQNETSNGTQLSNRLIKVIQKNNPDHLIAVDATSSMAGIALDFSAADVWLASVQKCFGLPAGLGLMVLSPRAIERMRRIGESLHYNSMTLMHRMMMEWQTPYTPNVMAIYLLLRTMEDRAPIGTIHARTRQRFAQWESFFGSSPSLRHLIRNENVRSETVLAIQADPALILQIKSASRKKGYLLGEGYGELKKDTFRIANFPAINDSEIKGLMNVLKGFL